MLQRRSNIQSLLRILLKKFLNKIYGKRWATFDDYRRVVWLFVNNILLDFNKRVVIIWRIADVVLFRLFFIKWQISWEQLEKDHAKGPSICFKIVHLAHQYFRSSEPDITEAFSRMLIIPHDMRFWEICNLGYLILLVVILSHQNVIGVQVPNDNAIVVQKFKRLPYFLSEILSSLFRYCILYNVVTDRLLGQ